MYAVTYDMGSRGRPMFDLNELPDLNDIAVDDTEDTEPVVCLQPRKALPSVNPPASELFTASVVSQGNKNAFSHASSVSGFQPFVRPRVTRGSEAGLEQKMRDQNPKITSLSNSINGDAMRTSVSGFADVEREEGEWSDIEGSGNACEDSGVPERGKSSQDKEMTGSMDCSTSDRLIENVSVSQNADNSRAESSNRASSAPDQGLNDQKSSSSRNPSGITNCDTTTDSQEEVPKQKEVKGTEANHALKYANNLGKRKIDQQKEAMLGKKRNRQTMLINIDEVKQASSMKTSTPRRPPTITRTVKEVRAVPPPTERFGEKHINSPYRDQKQVEQSFNEGGNPPESFIPKSESNGDLNSGQLDKSRRLNGETDNSMDSQLSFVSRQGSWKQPADVRPPKNSQFLNRKPALVSQTSADSKLGIKKLLPPKKPAVTNSTYQDTSVERLIREVTNEKFWHHPGICYRCFTICCVYA